MARKCPKCGATNDSKVAFCGNCGYIESSGVRSRLHFSSILILVTLSIVFGALKAVTALRLNSTEASPTISKPYGGEPPLLLHTARAELPAALKSAERMPQHIKQWLDHLKSIDDRRKDYNRSFGNSILNTLRSTDLLPGMFEEEAEATADEERRKNLAADTVNQVDTFFTSLEVDFRRVPPPNECEQIARNYSQALTNTRSMIQVILSAIEGKDANLLQKLQGQSYNQIDEYAKRTNHEIETICSRYGESNRWAVLVEEPGALSIPSLLPNFGGTQRPLPKLDEGAQD